MREVVSQGYRVQLDLSTQVLRLSVPEDQGIASPLATEGPAKKEASIAPTLSGLCDEGFVSASVLAQKAKQFDDGLYAAVELAAQQGAGRFQGKAALLRTLATVLTRQGGGPISASPTTILAAAKLGNPGVDLPAAAQQPVQQAIDEFLRNELRSKPIGFYTWNGDLSAIFQQDRMLQTELKDKAGTAVLVKALHADKQARATYEAYLALVSRLTNPLAYPDLRGQLAALDRGELDVPDKGIFFFPPSRAHETDLIKKLYSDKPIPEGFSLVDEMIKRIQAGQLPLDPAANSGWYDYQTWSLEPLVVPEKMPEAKHLNLDPSYCKQLLELFKGILALTRETHIKQLEVPAFGAVRRAPEVVIAIRPELSAEPLASHYFRRAWSYSYIRGVLEQSFDAAALHKMHRLTAAGPVQPNLAEELRSMEALFYGEHVTVCRQLGMPSQTSPRLGSGKGDRTDAALCGLAGQTGERSGCRPGCADDGSCFLRHPAQEDKGLGLPRLGGAAGGSRFRQRARSDRVRPGRRV